MILGMELSSRLDRARRNAYDAAMSAAWTIGHSTRSADALIDLLRGSAISLLVDVRTVPRSRHNPQFNRETLPEDLKRAGIDYRHEPQLGGLRKPRKDSINTGWRNAGFRGYADYMQTPAFAEQIAELVSLAERERVALMCAEAVPWRCHRSLIADALTVRGLDVRHILEPGEGRPHRLTSFARAEGASITYPGLV